MSTQSTPPGPDRQSQLRVQLERDLARAQLSDWSKIQLFLLLVLPLATLILWLVLVGYQRHTVELRTPSATFVLTSSRGPFDLSTPDADFARIRSGGIMAVIRDDVRSNDVQPRSYDWASVAITRQVVTPGVSPSGIEFQVNDRLFLLQGDKLASGTMLWTCAPGGRVEVELDRLSPAGP